MAKTFWTITNAGQEKSIEDWGIDDADATFTSQAEDEVTLSANGRKMDAAYLFAYKSTVVIRRDRVRALDGSFSGGSYYFSGICAHPHVSATGRREFQSCSIVGPWWFLNERGFEQEYKQVIARDAEGNVTLKSPNPTTSRIFLNLALGEYGQLTFAKLTTGQQLTEILNWTLKPFVVTATAPPFQIGSIGIAVDPPVDEVKNITCAEAARKMFRWSPDCVAWFDHTTSPPTFNVQRAAALTEFNLNIETLKPTSLTVTPRYDLQRSFVRIQYERTNTINGIAFPETIEDVWPDPIPTGALDQFGGVPFIIDLRGYVSNTTIASIKCAEIDTTSNDWWLGNEPEYKLAVEAGRVTSVEIDPASVVIKTENNEENLLLPNQLVAGTAVDWIPAGNNLASFQRLTASCKARVKYANGGELPDKTFSFQFTATNAATGNYPNHSGSSAGDAVPVNLAHDFHDAVSRLIYEGNVGFRNFELGGTPRLGHKLNILGSANEAWETMATLVQRVRENIHRRTSSVEFGTPPHLDISDLVSLFRVTRNRDPQNPYSLRSGGGASGGQTNFTSHTARHNNSNASGNYERIVASGVANPSAAETPNDQKGQAILDGKEKYIWLKGNELEGQVFLKVGTTPGSTMGELVRMRETEGCDPATGQKMYCMIPRSIWYPDPKTTTYGE